MIDPGAIGTLTIGVRRIQREEAADDRGTSMSRGPHGPVDRFAPRSLRPSDASPSS